MISAVPLTGRPAASTRTVRFGSVTTTSVRFDAGISTGLRIADATLELVQRLARDARRSKVGDVGQGADRGERGHRLGRTEPRQSLPGVGHLAGPALPADGSVLDGGLRPARERERCADEHVLTTDLEHALRDRAACRPCGGWTR